MSNLEYIKTFDNFFKDYFPLNESLSDGSQSVINQAFINRGPIKLSNGDSIDPKSIVKAVGDAINYLADDFHRTFEFVSRINIIYLCGNPKCRTMCVDENMNMYMDALFIYYNLKMDKELIGAVIMHEVFHVLFDHIERGKNWLGSKGLSVNPQTHHDNNLAADVEVNQTLVRLGVIEEERLTNEIHGMYLRNASGETGYDTNVVPMEVILENEKAMRKLREMCPPPPKPEDKPKNDNKETVKTTPEWDKAYKEAWDKVAELVNKYGVEEAMKKLQEAGFVDGMGDIVTDKFKPEDLLKLNMLQVKGFEEYINESKEESGEYKTADDGYMKGFQKALEKIKSALQEGGEGGEGQGGQEGPNIESGLKDDDLKQMNLPKNNNSQSQQNDSNGTPENVNQQSDSNDNDSDSKSKSKSQGSGSGNEKESTEEDVNKLSDDLKNKAEGKDNNNSTDGDNSSSKSKSKGSGQGGTEYTDGVDMNSPMNQGNVGGTGSFVNSKDISNDIGDMLKDSGYSEEDIEAINEIREKNKEKNTKKGIEKAREELKSKLRSSDPIKRYLDAIDIESSKYKNIWKEIMEDFMRQKTRRAGTKVNDTSINWKRKSRIALGNVGPQYQKVDQDPQDVNIYTDVSGSVDVELLEIIAKSIVIFAQSYKYSGITICPWASTSNGIHKVEEFNKHSEEEITKEILGIVSEGIQQCGGGTEAHAAIAALVDVCVDTLNDPKKKKKDDIHVIITDGQFNFDNIESKIRESVKRATDREDVADKAPKHCFWMIYDADKKLMDEWNKEIKEGTIIFINSETVKGNEKNS